MTITKQILIVLLLILLFLPTIQATYKTGLLGDVERVNHGNYSVAEIEGLHVRTDFDADYYYSIYDGEDSPYDALLGIEVNEINYDEIGLLKRNVESNIFEDSNYHLYYNESLNGINIYSFDTPTANYNVNYTYGICEKEGHTYYMSWDHGASEINETTLKKDADLFKEILDSIERND